MSRVQKKTLWKFSQLNTSTLLLLSLSNHYTGNYLRQEEFASMRKRNPFPSRILFIDYKQKILKLSSRKSMKSSYLTGKRNVFKSGGN